LLSWLLLELRHGTEYSGDQVLKSAKYTFLEDAVSGKKIAKGRLDVG
jgi:hypothetical protein